MAVTSPLFSFSFPLLVGPPFILPILMLARGSTSFGKSFRAHVPSHRPPLSSFFHCPRSLTSDHLGEMEKDPTLFFSPSPRNRHQQQGFLVRDVLFSSSFSLLVEWRHMIFLCVIFPPSSRVHKAFAASLFFYHRAVQSSRFF